MNSKKVYIKNNRRTILIYILSILLALMWAAAAFGKLTDLDTFHNELVKSPLLEGFANTVKWVVPCGELLLAIALIYRATQLFAFYTSVFLLSLFIAYIVVIIRFSYYDIPCACSGFAEGLSWEGHLIFNAICIMLAIVAIFISQEDHQGSNTGLRRYCTIGQKPARKKWRYTFFFIPIMKKIFTTILTIAVLGVGYVGAKAFEKKVEVRQETRWFESADGSEHNYKDEPLPASFNPETDCQGVEQTCAGLFEVDANNNPMGTPLAIQAGELQ